MTLESKKQRQHSSPPRTAMVRGEEPRFVENSSDNSDNPPPPTPSMTRGQWRQQVDQKLPSVMLYPRIAIIGSVDFYHSDSSFLCDAIGAEMAKRIPRACLLTGADAVVQEQLSRAFLNEKEQQGKERDGHVFHLAPSGYSCEWGFGTCLEAGQDSEQRRFILASLADVCISIEGGPGTVDEMNKAQWEGTIVVPVSRTGGASGGLFEAPPFPRPSFVPESTWDMLKNDQSSIQDSARAVVDIVEAVLRNRSAKDQTITYKQLRAHTKHSVEKAIVGVLDIQYAKRPTLPDNSPACIEPALAGCAHLVFQGSERIMDSDLGTLGDIYLGPKSAAELAALDDLQTAKIGGIVNCTNRVPCYHQGSINYCTVAINDEAGADILTYLDGATTFLHSLLKLDTNVLVHCEMGISRSATVVIAYLIRFENMTRNEAFLHVKTRRPKANPNPGFWDQLQVFQEQCRQNDGMLPSTTTEAFDIGWATKSNAMFATCHEIPEVLQNSEPVRCLSHVVSQGARERVLSVCLDFVWGRGVLDIDLEWLSFVCQMLDHEQTNEAGAVITVQAILLDKDSEFWNIWAGEIYEPQVQRVLEKLKHH